MGKELFEIAAKGDVDRLRELFDDLESVYATDPAQALNKRDKDGKSALDIAAMLGRKELVRELVERGAEINSQTKKGEARKLVREFLFSLLKKWCENWWLSLSFTTQYWRTFICPMLVL